jgi:hypothetical protein
MVPLNFVRTFLTIRGTSAGLALPGQKNVRRELIIDIRLEEKFPENPKVSASAERYDMANRCFSPLRSMWTSSRTRTQRRGRSENKTWQIHGKQEAEKR